MTELTTTQRVVIKLSGRITEVNKGYVKGSRSKKTEVDSVASNNVDETLVSVISPENSNDVSQNKTLRYNNLTKRFNTQNKGTKSELFRMITRFWASLLKPFDYADKKYTELKKSGIMNIEIYSKEKQYHFSDLDNIFVNDGLTYGKLKNGEIIEIYHYNENAELVRLKADNIQGVVVTRLNVRSFIAENQYSFPALIVITQMWDSLPKRKDSNGMEIKHLDDNDHLKLFYQYHPSPKEYEKLIPNVLEEIERFFTECPLILTSKESAIMFNKLDSQKAEQQKRESPLRATL